DACRRVDPRGRHLLIRSVAGAALVAFFATGAGAESMLEVIIGEWAVMKGSQAATDAENVSNATEICLAGEPERDLIAFEIGDGGLILTATGGESGQSVYSFDEEVRGGMLRDGRLALNFFLGAERSHDMVYWRVTIEGAEHDLLEVHGPPNPSEIYMKCPA
ncbi:MAG: hypothetical protein AAF439_16015, partial [Pseudomonadota bacterium]